MNSDNTISKYLKDIEEIEYANQIQAMMSLLEQDSLTFEEQELVRKGQLAKQELAKTNLRLVVSIANPRRQYRGHKSSREV